MIAGPYRDGIPGSIAAVFIAGLFLAGAAIAPDGPPTERPAPAPFAHVRLREPRMIARVPVRATAYTSSEDETDSTPWIGACGRVGPGSVALSSDLMRLAPCGSRVRAAGRTLIVRDHMPGRGRIDIWHGTKASARRFGVRAVALEVPLNPCGRDITLGPRPESCDNSTDNRYPGDLGPNGDGWRAP